MKTKHIGTITQGLVSEAARREWKAHRRGREPSPHTLAGVIAEMETAVIASAVKGAGVLRFAGTKASSIHAEEFLRLLNLAKGQPKADCIFPGMAPGRLRSWLPKRRRRAT